MNLKIEIYANTFHGYISKENQTNEIITNRFISGNILVKDINDNIDFTIEGPKVNNKYEVYMSSDRDTDIFYIDKCPGTKEEIISFLNKLSYS